MKALQQMVRTLEQAKKGGEMPELDAALTYGRRILQTFGAQHSVTHLQDVLLGASAVLEHFQGTQDSPTEKRAALRAQQLRMLVNAFKSVGFVPEDSTLAKPALTPTAQEEVAKFARASEITARRHFPGVTHSQLAYAWAAVHDAGFTSEDVSDACLEQFLQAVETHMQA